LLSACGSTVPVAQRSTGANRAADEFGSRRAGVNGSAASDAGAGDLAGSTAASTAGPSARRAAGGANAAKAAALVGPGVTADKIFAALSAPVGDSDNLLQCLQNRGVSLISTELTTSDAARFRRFPYYVELTMMNLDRIATAEIAALKAQGWFSGWNSVTGAPA